jgi:hypothetical protein
MNESLPNLLSACPALQPFLLDQQPALLSIHCLTRVLISALTRIALRAQLPSMDNTLLKIPNKDRIALYYPNGGWKYTTVRVRGVCLSSTFLQDICFNLVVTVIRSKLWVLTGWVRVWTQL